MTFDEEFSLGLSEVAVEFMIVVGEFVAYLLFVVGGSNVMVLDEAVEEADAVVVQSCGCTWWLFAWRSSQGGVWRCMRYEPVCS